MERSCSIAAMEIVPGMGTTSRKVRPSLGDLSVPISMRLAFGLAAAPGVGVLEPDVVVVECVENLCFDFAIGGVDDACVWSIGKGSDVVVDGLERLVEVLGWRSRGEKGIKTKDAEEEAQS